MKNGNFNPILLVTLILTLSACSRPNYVSKSKGVSNPPSDGSDQTGDSNPPSNGSDKTGEVSSCPIELKKTGFCVSYKWIHYPSSTTEPGRLLFKIFRLNLADQSPVPVDIDKGLKIFLWMPSMGHGSAPVKFEKKDIGTFEVSRIFFIMSGDWEIHFQMLEGSQIIDEGVLALDF